jgi:predicted nucleotidyltransferase
VGGEGMETILREFATEVRDLYGEELVAVFLYGSAASGGHVVGRSDINTGIVLRRLSPALLRKATPRIRRWHRRRIATPLFLDPDFLRTSQDVFPIEFLDMQEHHRVLFGPDLLAELRIDRANLRLQCEQEVKGKLLRLRQTYVESAASPAALEQVLMAVVSSGVVLARTLLRLGGEDARGDAEVVFTRAEARFGIATPGLRRAWQVKQGQARVAGSALDQLYQDVLEAFQDLARVVDGLPT